MKFYVATILLCSACAALAQAGPSSPTNSLKNAEISGLYSFLQNGEYLQLTVDAQGKISGIVTHFGELPSDRGAPLDHIIEKGSRDGERMTFKTRALHGTWFEFNGAVARGTGKIPGEEAYYLLRGTLTQYSTDAAHHTTARSREVELKSLPQDENVAGHKRD